MYVKCLKVHGHPIKRLVLFFFHYQLCQVQWMLSKCYQQRNLLPFKNWHYPTIAVSSSLLLLPNPNSDPLTQLRAQLINWPCIVVKETNSVRCRIPNKEKGQLMLKRSELLTGFQAGNFFFSFLGGLTAHGMWEFPDQGTKLHTLQCKVFNYWTSRETQAKICKGSIRAEGHRVPAQLVDFLLFAWW